MWKTKAEPHQIELQIARSSINDVKTERKEIKLKLRPLVDGLTNEVTMDELNEPINTICLYCKYRQQFIMYHRKERYNIILIPIYVIFIIYCIFVGLAINHRMSTTTISYFNHPLTVQFRKNVSEFDVEAIERCDVEFSDIYGWFDGLSYDFERTRWNDYSLHQNHINSSYFVNKIKVGIMDDNNTYIYGHKIDSIKMPSSLHLNKHNYTMMTIARYNGNDKNTIFASDDGEWIFGFAGNKNGAPYHDDWIINANSPNIFRSQQQTIYNETNNISNNIYDSKNKIVWGINIFNSSDWAVASIVVFSYSLSLSQIECVENVLINKYDLSANNSNNNNDDIDIKKPTIYECDRWQKGFDDYIISWYDVNNGLNGNKLFDFSENNNHIILDDNIKVGTDQDQYHYLYGSTNDSISIPLGSYINDVQETFWTQISYVARYNGNDKGSILTDIDHKFFCGFYEGNAGTCYWNNNQISEFQEDVYGDKWVLSSFYLYHPFSSNTSVNDQNYATYCTQNCDTSFQAVVTGDSSFNLVINGENNTDWALTEIIILKTAKDYSFQFVPFIDSQCVEQYLSNKYNIKSYRYSIDNIIPLQFFKLMSIILIIIGGIFVNVCIQRGFVGKMMSDTITQTFQGCNVFVYFLCKRCISFQGINCCCGGVKGICIRHFCGLQFNMFPIYNVVSVIASFTSIIVALVKSRNELFFNMLLNGITICLATIIHFIFTYQFLVGNPHTLDTYSYFYFIEMELCIFLWCIMIVHCIRDYVHDLYWIMIVSMYLYFIYILWIAIGMYNNGLSPQHSLHNLFITQFVLFIITLAFLCYYVNLSVHYWSYLVRSMLLAILFIISVIDQWDGIYKIWLFSFVLIQYINLYAGDFMMQPSTEYNLVKIWNDVRIDGIVDDVIKEYEAVQIDYILDSPYSQQLSELVMNNQYSHRAIITYTNQSAQNTSNQQYNNSNNNSNSGSSENAANSNNGQINENNNGTNNSNDGKDDKNNNYNQNYTAIASYTHCNNPDCIATKSKQAGQIQHQQQIIQEQKQYIQKQEQRIKELMIEVEQQKQWIKMHQTSNQQLLNFISRTTCSSVTCDNESFQNKVEQQNQTQQQKKQKKKQQNKKSHVIYVDNKPSYNPSSSRRVSGNIEISMKMTREVVPSKIGGTDWYKYMDKSTAIQLNDNLDNMDVDRIVIDYDFHDEKPEDKFYCIIEKQDVTKDSKYQWTMHDELYTAKQIKKEFGEQMKIPCSSRIKLKEQLAKYDHIKLLFNDKYEDIVIGKGWDIPVYRKKNNKYKNVMRIETGYMNKTVRRLKKNVRFKSLVPIMMFNGCTNKHWIEWILIIRVIENVDIGISFIYNENTLKKTGIHLEKKCLKEQHALISPQHVEECKCFDDWTTCIADIEICGDLNDANNKTKALKQQYKELKSFIFQFIDESPDNYPSLKQYACLLIEKHNGSLGQGKTYQKSLSQNVSGSTSSQSNTIYNSSASELSSTSISSFSSNIGSYTALNANVNGLVNTNRYNKGSISVQSEYSNINMNQSHNTRYYDSYNQ